jgi:transposase
MHGISSGQFDTWRKPFRTGELTGFVPFSVVPEPAMAALPPPCTSERASGALEYRDAPGVCAIEVELPSGIRVRLTGVVDEGALRRVISALA